MSVKYPQTIKIEFNKSDSYYTSSQSIIISELLNRASSSTIRFNSYNLTYKSSTNSYSISYKICYPSCKYLAFEILPYYRISRAYVKVTNNPQVYNYNLTSNSREYFSKLYESNIYKFYIPTKYDQKVEF